jgi:hypothetical protein
MLSTKKLLVAFDPVRPESQSSDFLIPLKSEGQRTFRGLKSGKESALGLMVFVGRSVTENDLLAQLVDSGAVIANVDDTLDLLRTYLDRLQSLKIGNVARIRPASPSDGSEFELELVAKTPGGILTPS